MSPNDTQPPPAPHDPCGASNLIGVEALQRKREARAKPTGGSAAETDRRQLASLSGAVPIGAVIGYFRHGPCIRVQHFTPITLFLHAAPYDAASGPLPDVAAYERLEYEFFAQVTWTHRSTTLAYVDPPPSWVRPHSASEADMLRKVFSLYDAVTKGDMMNAADDLVPNPAHEQADPGR